MPKKETEYMWVGIILLQIRYIDEEHGKRAKSYWKAIERTESGVFDSFGVGFIEKRLTRQLLHSIDTFKIKRFMPGW